MSESEYKINLYSPDSLHQVVDVLSYLWGDDFEKNLYYFKWKYDENPYVSLPLGVVAVKDSQVVGFRGYFATKWHLPEKNLDIIVLCPGDTCVHPDHRRKGLSVKMGRVAMAEYESEYNVFFNHSASDKSTPGYLKMGFAPLVTKQILTQCNILGLTKFILMSALKLNSRLENIHQGEYNDIVVSYVPKAQEMAAVVTAQKRLDNRFSLLQDEVFFNWRFNNKRNKYIFYYFREGQSITGYIVVRLAHYRGRGYICDYAAIADHSLEKILDFIIRQKHFDVLSIPNLGIPTYFLEILKQSGFQADNPIRLIEKRVTGDWPLLIRPVKQNSSEKDWYIEGIDMRIIDNWDVKGIASDAS